MITAAVIFTKLQLRETQAKEKGCRFTIEENILRFEDNGISRTQEFADHSLVFMVKDITKKFKQPIS